jgi:predicted ArsR family transcriptional regulator
MASLPLLRDLDPAHTAGPIGHRGPRGDLLLHLKRRQGATAAELAELMGCSLNAVRHHLKELEALALATHERTPNGVGAPAHTFRLTEAGHSLFPERYERTVVDLLDHVVRTEGREAAVALLMQQYDALASKLAAEVGAVPAEGRGPVIARVLAAEGYMATWRDGSDGGMLVEHHCPHRVVAERFPEMCAAEERVLSIAFGTDVDRRSRIAGGCGTCSYHVAEGEGDDTQETR